MPVLIETLRNFDGDALQESILKPLDTLITSISKYSVLPVYVLSFMISKINYIPKLVLSAYDDVALMTETSASNAELEHKLIFKTPDSIYPTVVVYPNDLSRDSILYSHSENYIYSSTFLIHGKDIKESIKNHLIDKVVLRSNTARTIFDIDIIGAFSEDGLVSKIPNNADVVRLPLINYAKKHPTYNKILTEIASGNGTIIADSCLAELFAKVKGTQSCGIPGSDIIVFKDFIKQKPTGMIVYSVSEEVERTINDSKETISIKNVALEMSFKNSKCTHVLFYRYMDKILDKIIGSYDESENSQINQLVDS